jgi:predicted ATPase
MIEKIIIENYKSIRKIDLDLKPINIFIGANGAGKSNFISFFEMIKKIFEESLQNYIADNGGIDNLLYFGRKRSEYIKGLIDFDNTNAYYFTLKPSQNNRAYFEREGDYFNLRYKKDKIYQSTWNNRLWGTGDEESNVIKSEDFRAKYIKHDLNSFKVYHFHDTSKNAKIKQPCSINDNSELKEDGGNISAFLFLLREKNPKVFKLIEGILKSSAPFFDKFDLKPDRINEQYIQLEWKERGSDMYLNAHNFSDGTLRMISLITLLLQPIPPKTIIIDEPELGLHPAAINILSGLIKKASDQSQIIISTQSVNLIDNFLPEDIITVDRADNQSVFNRLKYEDLKNWLDEYSISDIWNKNLIGGRP